MKRRVAEYFWSTGQRERDQPAMYLKTALILTWLAGSWALLVFAAQTWWQALPLGVSLAVALAAVGFSIQHDGGHNAYSRRRWVNKLAATCLDLMGASSYLWHWKHEVIHHTYTNVTGVDTDIEIGSVVRVTPHQKRRWFHRWQHLYLWPLYGITSARWHLYGDFKEVVTGWMGPHRIPRPKGWDLALFIGGKLFSIGWFLAVPMFFHPVWLVLGFYLLITAMMGVAMSIVFQLAHCVSEAEFPVPDPATGRLEESWAVHQVETTVDFARDNRALSWWVGGLNFQIEHHLFPRVCHIHYPAIAPIVEARMVRRGKRKGQQYAELKRETVRRLERLGRERALIYKTLVLTGLRKGELASLTVAQMDLNATPPRLHLNATDEKNREGSTLPLRADLAAELTAWIAEAGLAPSDHAFTVPAGLRRILDRDLKAAGIPKRDARGRTVDVHALRTTFGTWLSAKGVAPRVAQQAMRHSDLKLTMQVYTDPKLLDVTGALTALPALPLASQLAPLLAPARDTNGQIGSTVDIEVASARGSKAIAGVNVSAAPGNEKGPLSTRDNGPLPVGATGT